MSTQMALQENLRPNGWPLGLKNINTRLLEAADNSPQAAAVAAAEPSSLHVPSYSFSSFSSSNLDTESTASFFADQSVTLGRLIGINPRARGNLRFTNMTPTETEQEAGGVVSVDDEEIMCRCICVPLLRNIMVMKCKS